MIYWRNVYSFFALVPTGATIFEDAAVERKTAFYPVYFDPDNRSYLVGPSGFLELFELSIRPLHVSYPVTTGVRFPQYTPTGIKSSAYREVVLRRQPFGWCLLPDASMFLDGRAPSGFFDRWVRYNTLPESLVGFPPLR